jgi:hypothetical protein
MQEKSWVLALDGKETKITAKYDRTSGEIEVDGQLVEKWQYLFRTRDHHHVFHIHGNRCAVHFFYDPVAREFLLDASVDRISVKSGEPMEFRSSPSSEITKVWKILLADGEHQVILRHKMGCDIQIEWDQTLVEDVTVFDESSDHLLSYRGHQIGVHIKRLAEFEYVYDLSLDGVLAESGARLSMLRPTPVNRCRTKTWMLFWGDREHRVTLQERWFRPPLLLLDGQKVPAIMRGIDQQTAVFPLKIGSNQIEILLRHRRDKKEWDLLVDGVSPITGEALAINWSQSRETPSGFNYGWRQLAFFVLLLLLFFAGMELYESWHSVRILVGLVR